MTPTKGTSVWAIVLGLVGAIALAAGVYLLTQVPDFLKDREIDHRIKCAANLRDIGAACLVYANLNKGEYPDSLQTLATQGSLSPQALICPSSDHKASAASGPQLATDITAGGHCSYVYAGKGLKNYSSPSAVVIYEQSANHKNMGMNVLYLDGHVDWLDAKDAQALIMCDCNST